MLRACVKCSYRSDPSRGACCPECGEKHLPLSWQVVLREAPPWLWRSAHVGSVAFLALSGYSVYALLVGTKPVGIGAVLYVGMISLSISVARLSGARLDDIWIVTETRLEHRPSRGSTTFHDSADGWRAEPMQRHAKKPHLWVIILSKQEKRKVRRVPMLIDERLNDPAAVEAAVIRALTPASASGT